MKAWPLRGDRWPAPAAVDSSLAGVDGLVDDAARAMAAIDAGDATGAARWAEVARRADLAVGPDGPRVGPLRTTWLPDTAALARVALDASPDRGADAPAAILGRWADGLDLRRPAHRAAWRSAVALSSLAFDDALGRHPLRAAMRGQPRPPLPVRDGYHAAYRAPYLPFRIEGPAAQARLRPLLGVGAGWHPVGAVDLQGVGAVDGGPIDGGLLLARVVPVEVDGGTRWVPLCGLALPRVPAPARLEGWVARLAVGQRLVAPNTSPAEAVRRAGHQLAGFAHRWWWTVVEGGGAA